MKLMDKKKASLAEGILPWHISMFKGGFTTVRPSSVVVKEEAVLRRLFAQPPWRAAAFNKKKLDCWSPALYPEGKTRANKNVAKISAVVFDYDDPDWSAARMATHLNTLGIANGVYTTWSHTDEAPRYRVVIFLSRPLKIKEVKSTREAVLSLIGYTDGVDTQCEDYARHYALPVRRTGASYESYLELSLPPLCVDSLMTEQKDDAEGGLVLTPETVLVISSSGETADVAALIEEGPDKYKCACPFQGGASFGSAFLRVCKDGRVFLQCTSDNHDHEQKQFWLGNKKEKKKKASTRSAAGRKELLGEIPDSMIQYVETNLCFNFPQGVFYRRETGAWQIQTPLRKETIVHHLVGKLSGDLSGKHVQALVDHILSRQVYGFECDSSRGAIVPNHIGPMLNLYAKPEVEPSKGAWPRIEKMLEVLSSGDASVMNWLLHWSASVVQRPERRSMVAVLCLSPQQGIGKSMYGRILAHIIGERNSAIVSNRALKDSFNASYVTKLLVLADEVGIGGKDGDVTAALKAYITDDRVPCRAPYAARTEVQNRMTWWLTSNERRPLMVEEDDRRFTVLVPEKVDPEYRKMLSKCFDPSLGKYTKDFAEEVSAFAHALHALKVDYSLIAKPHETKARLLLQAASRSSIEHFVRLVLQYGPASLITDYPAGPEFAQVTSAATHRAVSCELLYGSYKTWCERHGRRDVYQEMNLRLCFQQMGAVAVKRIVLGGQGIYCYLGLPSPSVETKSENVISISPEK
tara:strand:- start:33544 stop:35790 length:2247 start_codon:yes stop_codon:yes gene_type:complete